MKKDIYQEYRPYKGRKRQAEQFYLDPHKRPRSRARILSDQDNDRVETHILSRGGAPTAYLLKHRLARYAGLRVGEILNIHRSDLVEPDGRVSDYVTVRPKVGKGGKGRKVPMHPRLAEAIRKFQLNHPDMTYVAFSQQHYTPIGVFGRSDAGLRASCRQTLRGTEDANGKGMESRIGGCHIGACRYLRQCAAFDQPFRSRIG